MKLKYIPLLLIVLVSLKSMAQVPTTQDCLGAIAVCDYVYTEETTAYGEGNYPNEIPSNQSCPNHCMDGEKNTRWYTWTVIQSGDLMLTITPTTASDDYDWAVFNLSEWSCEDIYSHPIQMMVSCNAAGGSGYQGVTGISSLNGGVSDCNNGGNTNKWNVNLPVYEGETYALVVSDWTQTPGGYTLDFSNSTAVILDDQDPFLDHVGNNEITACGSNSLNIYFNENIKCSSIQPGDFKLEGPGGPYTIDSIYGENCSIGGEYERNYTLYFTPAIYQPGEFKLIIKTFSFLSDICNNYANPDTLSFNINLEAPTADAGQDIDIAYAATATLDGNASGGSEDYAYHWEPADLLDNPDVPNPTTVNLTTSTQFILTVDDNVSTCKSDDTMWVNIVGGPLTLSTGVDKPEICNGEIINLFAMPEGGSGNYTYSWTSNPPGFTSTQQNPSDYPTNNITYMCEVTDGFTTLNSEVSVKVNQNPVADAGEDIEIELGNTATLNGSASGGSGNYLYQWEPASWLEQNDVPNPTTLLLPQTTQFNLLITDGNTFCVSQTDEMFVTVTSDVLSAGIFANPQQICLGESTTITAIATGGGGGYQMEWTSEPAGFTSTESSFNVSPTVTTKYKLYLKDQFNNEYNGSITIVVNPLPIIDLVPETYPEYSQDTIKVCVRDTIQLDAGFDSDPIGSTYFWKTDNYENRFFTASTTGSWIDIQTHTVVVTNGNTMCTDSGSITIIFDFAECQISVPEINYNLENAISVLPNPNNGNFFLLFKENVRDLKLMIFDSRGSRVYEQSIDGVSVKDKSMEIQSKIENDGVYILVLQTETDRLVKRLIVQTN